MQKKDTNLFITLLVIKSDFAKINGCESKKIYTRFAFIFVRDKAFLFGTLARR